MQFKGILVAVLIGICGFAMGDVVIHGNTTINLEFVTIADEGNDDHDTYEVGGVDYVYRIGRYEVTVTQWAAVKAADARIGLANGSGSVPAGRVSWLESAKFCNWLTSGDAYTGAYAFDGNGVLTGVDRAAARLTYSSVYVIPSEDEWVKAAYSKGDGTYSIYPNGTTGSGTTSDANYSGGIGSAWDVGSGTVEQNGTYDMGGNVAEWTEDAADGTLNDLTENRRVRGGAYNFSYTSMKISTVSSQSAGYEGNNTGFRVAVLTGNPPSLKLLLITSL